VTTLAVYEEELSSGYMFNGVYCGAFNDAEKQPMSSISVNSSLIVDTTRWLPPSVACRVWAADDC